ncbi:MAG: EthD family reductase [Rhizobiaceae bacterium]
MTRVTLIYRKMDGAHFDFDYYVNHHVVMSRKLLADCDLISIEVEKILHDLEGNPSDIICITHVDFKNEHGLTKALELHGDKMMSDFKNYTNIDPEIQICEILTTGL